MRKGFWVILMSVLTLASCGKNTILGEQLFLEDLTHADKIYVYNFDETVTTIDNQEEVNAFCDALMKAEYRMDIAPEMEGLYMVEIVVGDEHIDLGIGDRILAYDGRQYPITDNGNFSEVIEIIRTAK